MASRWSDAVLRTLLISSALFCFVRAETYDLSVSWLRRNPDGLAERSVIGVNGQWPIPVLNFTVGENVIVNLHNQLGNQSTSLHFHGLFQNGTNAMDGPVGVTQCDVPPGSSFTYNFTIDQPGTYWYHSHSRGQYPDGLRGQFVVHDPMNPYRGQFDEEISLTLSDWYHGQMPELLDQFVSYTNPTGAEPVPDSVLMNDTQSLEVAVQPRKTYFLRIANVGAFASQYFWIEGHNMTIIEVDGVYTEPASANMIYLTAAQRYGVLVTTKNDTSANFPIMSSMDTDLFDTVPDSLNYNATGWLVYDKSAPLPAGAEVDEWTDYDDFTLQAQDGMAVYDKVDHSVSLDLTMQDLGDGANYAFFNDISYVRPKVPTLYTAMSVGGNNTDARVYGRDTNAFVLAKGEVVEIVLNNDDGGKHPFHLHGHSFQVVARSDDDAGHYDPSNHTDFPAVPMRRDTVMVRPNGNFVVRFKADNPGVWLFHCHIEWHLATGLIATFIEDPTTLRETQTIPQQHYDTCKAAGVPYQGNAAGNTADVFDLTGENLSVSPLPAGFTARGIVALVFSCLSAFLGMAVIAWYGSAPLSPAEVERTKRFVEGSSSPTNGGAESPRPAAAAAAAAATD